MLGYILGEMEESPQHTALLKRKPRRTLLSTDGDEPHPLEVQEQIVTENSNMEAGAPTPTTPTTPLADQQPSALHKVTKQTSREEMAGVDHTPSAFSRSHSANSGSNQMKREPADPREGIIIQFTYTSHSPWQSDDDSDTSTPDFKRGKHSDELTLQAVRELQMEGDQCTLLKCKPTDELTLQAVRKLRVDGSKCPLPAWVQRRKNRSPSVLILADSQLQLWPGKDKICRVELRPG